MNTKFKQPHPWPVGFNNVVIIGTGAIGATMIPAWCTLLRSWYSVDIKVVLTHSATNLVSPSAISAVSSNEVISPGYTTQAPNVTHRYLAEWADIVIVAPATANYITSLAQGNLSGNALLVPVLADCPVVIAPSLPPQLRRFPPIAKSIDSLFHYGFHIIENDSHAISVHSNNTEPGGLVDIVSLIQYISDTFMGDVK